MENASKALIMAGEILIALIVLSIISVVTISFGKHSKEMHKKMADQQNQQFNNNFLIYSNRTNITAQEIVTIINYAKIKNDERGLAWNDYTNEYYVEVYIDNTKVFRK